MTAWPRPDDPRWGPPPDRSAGAQLWADDLADLEWTGPVAEEDEAAWVDGAHAALAGRLTALGHAARLLVRYVSTDDAPSLAAAAELAAQGGERLALREHGTGGWAGTEFIVVALAGPTGTGKSSVFNALAGLELSPPGHLRPTTGEAYACVWGTDGADPLLDWLGVAPQRRFRRESPLDADDEAPLRGLVLIDLPDLDSIATANRVEADRLLRVVDRVIWVLDPQKYADQAVHEYWRARMGALRGVTVVVLNQTDRLTAADADRCRVDLARLVEEDLPGAPVVAASTVTGDGIGELRGLLEKVVADRLAAAARLEAELAEAVASLMPLAPHAGPTDLDLSQAVKELADAFATACGIDALAVEAATADGPRWPWKRRTAAPAPPADPAAVGQAVRRLVERVGAALPEPWSRQLRTAVAADVDRLPDELARALTHARDSAGRRWLPLRRRKVVARRMREAALTVARELVAPVRQLLRDYGEVRAALERAGTPASQ